MKRYSTIHPLFMSFYSRSLYQDVGKNWRGISFLYLFLLLGVSLIPLTFRTHSQVSAYLSLEAPKIVEQVPVITISKGVVSVDAQMPYIIREPEGNAEFFIIDTTGKITSLEGSDAVALLTKTSLILRRDTKETRAFDLSGIDGLTIDQSKMYSWIESFVNYFPLVFYPLALLFSFLSRFIQAILFSLMGMIFAKNVGVPLRYRQVLSLSLVSMTPSIILNTLYQYTDVRIPFWWLINFLTSLGYLFFAIKANAGETNAISE